MTFGSRGRAGMAEVMEWVLWLGVAVVVVALLALLLWRRGGPHGEVPPEKR